MAVPARCKISSPGWTVSLCSETTPGMREERVGALGVKGTSSHHLPLVSEEPGQLRRELEPIPLELSGRSKVRHPRTSLVVQWLRRHLPVQGAQVQSLVRELRSLLCSVDNK